MLDEILALLGAAIFIMYLLFVSYLLRRVVDRDFLYPLDVSDELDESIKTMERASLEKPHEEWEIASADLLTLHAIYQPSPNPSNRFVIYVPGYRMTWSQMLPFRASHDENSHALYVTPRAQGESEGDFISYGVLESDDLIRWCEAIYERFGNESKILLHGVSLGAAACLLASANPEFPPDIEGVIADSSFDSAYHVLSYQFRRKFHLPAWTCLPVMDLMAAIWYPFSFRKASIIKAMPQIKTRVLILHGYNDHMCPSSMAEAIYRVSNHESTKLVWFEHSGHGKAIYQHQTEYIDTVKTWIQ